MFPKYRIEFVFGVGETKDHQIIYSSVRDLAIDKIKHDAAKLFGGYTLLASEGGWINPRGKLIEEPSRSLVVVTGIMLNGEDERELAEKVDQLKGLIKAELQQESVFIIKSEII